MGKREHYLREVSEKEEAQLRTLSNSRTELYRTVQRVKLIVSMIDDSTLTAKQAGFKLGISGVCWVKRFNKKVSKDSLINRRVANRVFIQLRCGAN